MYTQPANGIRGLCPPAPLLQSPAPIPSACGATESVNQPGSRRERERERGRRVVGTCVGEVSQGAAEGAPFQPLPHGVGVVQTPAVHVAVARLLLQPGALRHAGPHHALLLLQLRCGGGCGKLGPRPFCVVRTALCSEDRGHSVYC